MSSENSSNSESVAAEQEDVRQLAERFDKFLEEYTPFIYPFVSPAIIRPRYWGMFISRLYRIDPVMRTRPLPHMYSPTVKQGARLHPYRAFHLTCVHDKDVFVHNKVHLTEERLIDIYTDPLVAMLVCLMLHSGEYTIPPEHRVEQRRYFDVVYGQSPVAFKTNVADWGARMKADAVGHTIISRSATGTKWHSWDTLTHRLYAMIEYSPSAVAGAGIILEHLKENADHPRTVADWLPIINEKRQGSSALAMEDAEQSVRCYENITQTKITD